MPDQDGARSERVRGIASTHLQKGHRRLHLIILIALAEHLGGDFTQCGRRRPALRDGPSAPSFSSLSATPTANVETRRFFQNAIPGSTGFEGNTGCGSRNCGMWPNFRFFSQRSLWRAGQISLMVEKHGCYPPRFQHGCSHPRKSSNRVDDSDARGKVRGACRVGAIRGNAPRRGGRERWTRTRHDRAKEARYPSIRHSFKARRR